MQDTKGKSRRLVALNDGAVDALSRLRAVADEFFPDTPWVFTHTKPRYFGTRIQSVRRVWETAIGRAGIPWATPPSLRHTSITEAVHVPNSNVVAISSVAGHKNLKTTQIYIYTADERAHEAVANLQNLVTLENWVRLECQNTSRKLAPGARLKLATYGLTVHRSHHS